MNSTALNIKHPSNWNSQTPWKLHSQANAKLRRPKWQTDSSEPTQLMLEPHKGVGLHFAAVMAKGGVFRQERIGSNFEPLFHSCQESFLEKKGLSSYFHVKRNNKRGRKFQIDITKCLMGITYVFWQYRSPLGQHSTVLKLPNAFFWLYNRQFREIQSPLSM